MRKGEEELGFDYDYSIKDVKALNDGEGIDEININDHSDPVTVLRALIVTTKSNDEYSKGFRDALRFAIAVLTNTETDIKQTDGG